MLASAPVEADGRRLLEYFLFGKALTFMVVGKRVCKRDDECPE